MRIIPLEIHKKDDNGGAINASFGSKSFILLCPCNRRSTFPSANSATALELCKRGTSEFNKIRARGSAPSLYRLNSPLWNTLSA